MSKARGKIRGRVRVELCGAFPESVLNMAAVAAVELWDLEPVDDYTLRLSLYESDYERLSVIAEKCMCQLSRLSVHGGSRNRQLLRRRKWLLVFALCMGVLIFISSLFIWEVDVYGNKRLSRGEVLRALSSCGVDCGTYWPGISADLVRSEMIRLLPEIGWMTVNINGSRAVVLISERQEKPEIYDEQQSADILASKTGIISNMTVLNGKPLAAQGQAVVAGEKLISGRMDSITAGERYVRARGQVLADTWYELSSITALKEEGKEPSSVSRSRFAVVLGKRRINLYIDSGKAIDECDKIIHEYKMGAEGLFALPLRIIREELVRYRSESQSLYDEDEMKQSLERELSRIDGQILSRSFTAAEAGESFVLTMRAHCIEDIALCREPAE